MGTLFKVLVEFAFRMAMILATVGMLGKGSVMMLRKAAEAHQTGLISLKQLNKSLIRGN